MTPPRRRYAPSLAAALAGLALAATPAAPGAARPADRGRTRTVAARPAVPLPVRAAVPDRSQSAAAPNLTQKRQQWQQVQRRLQQERARLQAARQKERHVLADLERLDRDHEQAERRLAVLERRLRDVRAKAQATGTEVAASYGRLARQRRKLTQRLRDYYKWGRTGYVDVLLAAADFPEFVSRVYLIGRVFRADAQLLETMDQEATRWRALQERLEREQEDVELVLAQVHIQKTEIEKKTAARQALLHEIQQERAVFEQLVQELEEESRHLETLIRRMQVSMRRPVVASRGNLIWPLVGDITSQFGLRRHPVFRLVQMHNGVDIAGAMGTPVAAAGDGQVIFAGWFGGYGKLVVVDHGGGLSTLYGHLSEIVVEEGTAVGRGQVIGRVGMTGYTTGPHLHFEIRIDGRPVNPMGR